MACLFKKKIFILFISLFSLRQIEKKVFQTWNTNVKTYPHQIILFIAINESLSQFSHVSFLSTPLHARNFIYLDLYKF